MLSMRFLKRFAPALAALLVGACDTQTPTACCALGTPSLRVVNGFTTPVEVSIDGNVAISSLAAGEIATTAPTSGGHTLSLRPVGGGVSTTQAITTTAGGMTTVAAVPQVRAS